MTSIAPNSQELLKLVSGLCKAFARTRINHSKQSPGESLRSWKSDGGGEGRNVCMVLRRWVKLTCSGQPSHVAEHTGMFLHRIKERCLNFCYKEVMKDYCCYTTCRDICSVAASGACTVVLFFPIFFPCAPRKKNTAPFPH